MRVRHFLVCAATYGGTLLAQSRSDPDTLYKVGQGISGQISLAYGKRYGDFGFQFGMFNNAQPGFRDLDEGPLTQDARFLGNYPQATSFGGDLLYFFGPRDRNFHVGLGLYQLGISTIWRSPSTGQLFDLGSRDVYRATFSLGFSTAISSRVEIGLGYHTLLGWNLSYTVRAR